MIFRFIRLLALSLWMGSIFFFAAVVAPTAFAVLPSRTMAGQIVSHSLFSLHWIGIVCGLLFLLCGVLMALFGGNDSPFHLRDVLLLVMIGLTLFAHFGVERKMNALKEGMGIIENVPQTDARRIEFNRLHKWSTKLEGSVFIAGLGLMLLLARERNERERRY